jgi:hypothetical protein
MSAAVVTCAPRRRSGAAYPGVCVRAATRVSFAGGWRIVSRTGDAEIDELHNAIVANEHIVGREVAVDDQVAVCERRRSTNVEKELRALGFRSLLRRRPMQQWQALNQFHDKVGRAVRRLPAVKEMGDVRVAQPRQRLPLAFKARDDFGREKSRFDHLDRDRAREIAGVTLSLINGAHTALAKPLQNSVGSDAFWQSRAFERANRAAGVQRIQPVRCLKRNQTFS